MVAFSITIEIGDPRRERFLPVEVLADSGSTFTRIPRRVLMESGHRPRFRVPLRLADGRRVEAEGTDGVPIRILDAVREATCLFAEDGQPTLLGATTLENHLLAVDPVGHRLVAVEALAMAGDAVTEVLMLSAP